MARDGSEAAADSVVEAADDLATQQEGFEVSPQQRRTWLYEADRAALHAQAVIDIQGKLESASVKQALEMVVSRHEILRTTFGRVPGRTIPVQVIRDFLAPHWEETDLSAISPADQPGRLSTLLRKQAELPFNFAKGPILNALLVCLGPDHSVLSFMLPAVCADSPSLKIILQEIAGFLSGSAPESDPLQYADIADWQNQQLESQTTSDPGYAFWKQQSTEDQAASLPFEIEPKGPFQAGRMSVPLSPKIATDLAKAAESQGASRSAILAGCWQVLLSRYTGSWDILVHHIADGRPEAELMDSLGPLARWLPVPVSIDSSSPASRAWRRTDKAAQDTAAWQHSFNWGAAPGQHAEARAPQFGFAYETAQETLSAGALRLDLAICVSYSEPFKLELRCVESSSGLTLSFHYDRRRYTSAAIAHLASCYIELLSSALASPDAPVGSLSVLPSDEREKVLVGWNSTARSFPSVPSVHSLFEAWAQKTPSAPAVVFEGQSLSYADLNSRANQLAHHLRKQGVGKDTCVGLCVERSLEMVVGLLGIMKAGGAYVPLDPALPSERLSGMLSDSGARIVVQSSSAPALGAACVSLSLPALLEESVENLPSEDLSSSLVYVIYTSGSTGKPKGVGIEHQNLVNYVLGVTERLGLEPG
ncbi:MAG TPA: condensation domain-containing protein, partial [Capsulimonadaceae bacterium]|nr:condensation domain-containing protein [Capsulimonadaceae bacterium]